MIVLLNGMPLSVDNESHQQGEGRLFCGGDDGCREKSRRDEDCKGRQRSSDRTGSETQRKPESDKGQRQREMQVEAESESASSCGLLLRRLGALADAKEDGPRQVSVGVGRKAQAVNVDTC